MEYTMGIDIGSTTIKAEVYDSAGNFIAGGSVKTPLSEQTGALKKRFVWEPERIWGSVCSAANAAAGKCDKSRIRAVAVTGFGFDGLPMDKAGRELYPIISWHCNRTEEIYSRVSHSIGEKRIFDTIGKPAMFYDAIYRLLWLKENAPQAMEKIHKWLFIEDYVNFRLCGEFATDYTMADCTSLFRPDTFSYDEELAREAGIDIAWLPDAFRSGAVLGKLTKAAAKETGLCGDTLVVLGGHDYDCASFAVGAITPGIIMDVTGTWEMLCMASEKLAITEELYNSGMYIDNHVVDGAYVYMSAQVSGDMTEWMRENLAGEERALADSAGENVWSVIIREAQNAPVGANGCTFLPLFSGSMCPVMDKRALGAFLGLSGINTKADMLRSIYEGLDYLFRHTVEKLMSIAGGATPKVVATGGATKNAFWMQNKSDVSGLEIAVPEIHEATTLGTAMIAALGAGIYKSKEEAVKAVKRKERIYEPDATKTEQYTDYFNNIYLPAFGALAEVSHSIFDRFK